MSASLASHAVLKNNLLSALPSKEYEQLRPHLEHVQLPSGKILYDSGEPIRHVYFPLNSIVFLLATMEDGATAEVGVVGCEGMLGVSVLMGVSTTPTQAVALTASDAMRTRAEVLKAAFDRGGWLQTLLFRYMQALFVQVSQTAACNRVHGMEGRLCRWLLMMHDRLQSNDLPLTQECIATMLGTRRPYITVAAGLLQRQEIIRYHRGHLTILNRRGLEARTCECYSIVRREFNRLLGGNTPCPPNSRQIACHGSSTHNQRLTFAARTLKIKEERPSNLSRLD